MKTDLVKGFRDFFGEESKKREEIKKILVGVFERYGFQPAETPVVEYEEFVRGENEQDEAISDIFKLQDKGKRKLALRYEFTFQLKRLMKNMKLPFKRYQIGPVFRDEPVSENRFRQFTQCDADTIGSTIKDDAEILAMAKEALEKLGIKYKIYFNNRKLLNEILSGFDEKNKIMREIDKLNKLSEKEIRENLKKLKAEKILEIFKKDKKYFEKYKSYKEIKEFEKYLGIYGMKAEFLPSLVRGLSYYNGTIFEIKTQELKETIVGGGAYMFNNNQCVGISFGLERLSSLAKVSIEKENFLVISLGKDKESIKLAEKLRKKGDRVSIYYGKPSKALDYANSYKFSKVIFIGDEEIKNKKYKIKDLKTGKEIFEKF